MTNTLSNRKNEKGFTLVELAIVMIIIGLLITGILKGQEMIANARVTSTVSQVKGIDAATSTFRDKYNAVPGDMLAPATRLVNCTGVGACSTAGNGNGLVDSSVPAAAPGAENQRFFVHLNAADLIGGINPANASGPTAWGTLYPKAEINGGFNMGGYFGAVGGFAGNANARAGHYLALVRNANVIPGGNNLTANQASRIDIKLDDGVGNAGSVFGPAAAACQTAGVYQEQNDGTVCDLFIRFQN